MIDIDHAHRHQSPGQQQHCSCLPGETEMPSDIARKQAARQLHEGIATTDRRAARRTLATQGQPADHGDILPSANLMITVRAPRTWQQQIEALTDLLRRALEILKRLRTPLTLHHDRQAINHDVEEAADQQAQQSSGQNKGQHVAGQIIHQHHNQTTAPSWKIGRYMAMIKPPTSTPSTAMIIGSIRAVSPSTILSTSSS